MDSPGYGGLHIINEIPPFRLSAVFLVQQSLSLHLLRCRVYLDCLTFLSVIRKIEVSALMEAFDIL